MKSLVLILLLLPAIATAQPLTERWRYAKEYSRSAPGEVDYLLGLGAYQKIHGHWRLDDSEVVRGNLDRVTWQMKDGFTAREGFDWYAEQLPENAEQLFYCEGRACGSSAQWANRIFEERVLYGNEGRQRYGVWRLREEDTSWTVVIYGVDRAFRRHLVRIDRLRHLPPPS